MNETCEETDRKEALEFYRILDRAAKGAEAMYLRDVDNLTFKEVGARLGVCSQRAHQIYGRACRKRRYVLVMRGFQIP